MPPSPNRVESDWTLVADGHFQEFDEFAESIRGWGVDFRQLEPGRSPSELLQFGSSDFLVTRFHMCGAYDQQGSTPPGLLTLGFVERGSGKVLTPEGAVTEEEIWCFSANREFSCASKSNFRAFGLSISESLLDGVSDVCKLQDIRAHLGSNQVVRCGQRSDIDGLRNRLARMAGYFKGRDPNIKTVSPQCTHALQVDLVREVLQTLAGPLDGTDRPLSSRRQLVLRRALDYLDASPNSFVTVHELAEVVGAGVRTLEYAFREYYGVAPKAYLTARRLIGARRELRRSDATETQIRNVAYNWGFWHLGRFSADYRKFFGELPSQTLKDD